MFPILREVRGAWWAFRQEAVWYLCHRRFLHRLREVLRHRCRRLRGVLLLHFLHLREVWQNRRRFLR